MVENLEFYRNQVGIARTEIKNLRLQLSALKHEHIKDLTRVKSILDHLRCSNCADAATTIISTNENQNASRHTNSDEEKIEFHPIGFIETSFQNKRCVPRQPAVMANARGAVVLDLNIFNNPEHALDGLEEFSHMWVIFHFHMTESTSTPAKVAPPRLGGERRGVFSTRSPHRHCPIGLSLVKILNIEGNKIHFLGVDMVNGTPVLDIKPYIPQYDYPWLSSGEPAMARPPTEGVSDVLDDTSIANLQIDSESEQRPRNTLQLSNSDFTRDQYLEDLPSPENRQRILTPVSPLPESPASMDALDGNDYNDPSPIHRPESTERGAPDGQERFTPPNSAQLLTLSDGIRVPTWITNPPSQTYEVRFTEDANDRLTELIGNRAGEFKTNIQSLLSQDPRSQYVRTRYPDHEYSCLLEELSISCVFDSSTAICTIVAIRNADDLQC